MILSLLSSAVSEINPCPALSNITSSAPGILEASILEFSGGIRRSRAPVKTSVGALICGRRS